MDVQPIEGTATATMVGTVTPEVELYVADLHWNIDAYPDSC